MANASQQFDRTVADFKQLVTLRQGECTQIGTLVEAAARHLSKKASRIKNALIVLGAVVAAKALLEANTGLPLPATLKAMMPLVFVVLGVCVAVLAGLEKQNRYAERAGEARELGNLCRSSDRRFMSDYKRFVDPASPDTTVARLESLVDLQNDALDNIRHRCASLGVDLSGVSVSYRL